MQDNFDTALGHVLKHEGGYANRPRSADPGGATYRGITQKTYDRYRKLNGEAPRDVRMLTADEIRGIYWRQYWLAVSGNDLPAGLDYAVFDFAVHSGPVRAIKELQAVLGLRTDGHIGTITLDTALESDIADTIKKLCKRRMGFLRKLKNWGPNRNGWTNRVTDVQSKALAMVESEDSDGVDDDWASDKAMDEDVAMTSTTTGQGAATASLGLLGGTVTDAAEKVGDFADYSEYLRIVFIGLLVVGIGLTVYGVWKNKVID